jgi:integrase/recombinase XerC
MSPPVRRKRGGNQRRDPIRRSRPVAEWPQLHREAWDRAPQPGDRLHPGGPASRRAPRSVAKIENGYGRFLTWHDLQGNLNPDSAPGEGVTDRVVADYIDHLLAVGNSSQTAICRIEELYNALRVMAPAKEWRWLYQFVGQLKDEALPSSRRLAQEQHAKPKPLLDLGLSLMARAEAPNNLTELQEAMMFRDGAIIALLAARPIRVANFASLRMDHSFIGDGASYKIMLNDDETKNRRRLEYEVPAPLMPEINRYIDHYRPILMTCGSRYTPAAFDWLWVSREGGPLSPQSLRKAVNERTEAAFGVAIPPHRFRDAAATDFADKDPAHALAAALVLGNHPVTMRKYYNKSRGGAAHQRYHDAIDALRGMGRGK